MKIYVASSWRNMIQPRVVAELRGLGHEVYDFKNPPNRSGFGWEQIAGDWKEWDPAKYRRALLHPLAREGFAADIGAMRAADTCVLVLPCGRSAHLELGWFAGRGRECFAYIDDGQLSDGQGAGAIEPELMYKMLHPSDCGEINLLIGRSELVHQFTDRAPLPWQLAREKYAGALAAGLPTTTESATAELLYLREWKMWASRKPQNWHAEAEEEGDVSYQRWRAEEPKPPPGHPRAEPQ